MLPCVKNHCFFCMRPHLYYAGLPKEEYNPELPTKMEVYSNDERMPAYWALVGATALMTGESTRLVLMWRRSGFDSLGELIPNRPEEAMRHARCSAHVAGSLERRQRPKMQ